ncbi:DNA polymerase IV [Facilibium subflavum]|uniref:DNA polymerase IV n=1 Tax=Facilibium subflavum TaxID=2219058 RepID=UPI000E6512F9|nr:DNA polymerase IV [Facilibium subflavum]
MRKIIHIDLDYFYAQVEEKENPTLVGKPVAIGGSDKNRGVLATCNYIARRYGLHSAMPTSQARKKCPNLILLPVDMPKYKAISQQIKHIFLRFTPLVEPLSLDEAYLDVSNVQDHDNSATLIAQQIRQEIRSQTGLTASAGVAPNKLLAKIASDINKPDGLYTIPPQNIQTFIHDLPVKKLFGVGKVTQEKLKSMGIELCWQLQQYDKTALVQQFGKFGHDLYDYCRGQDKREVMAKRLPKSIAVEQTYPQDLAAFDACIAQISVLYQKLILRINTNQQQAKIHGIGIKLTDFQFKKYSITRQSTQYSQDLFIVLFKTLYDRINKRPIRLIGLYVRVGSNEDKQIPLLI